MDNKKQIETFKKFTEPDFQWTPLIDFSEMDEFTVFIPEHGFVNILTPDGEKIWNEFIDGENKNAHI